jgi:peptide/nickel transport system substrate-binding protein
MPRWFCAALVVALLAGCVQSSSVGGRHPWTIPHVLRIADITDPDHLNPYLSEMDLVYDLSSLIYSYLVIADDHGRLIGDLATGVPTRANGGISADGKTYTYHLRHGVLWQDGVRLTSRDIVSSWRAIVNPRNDVVFREGYTDIASIDTPDDYTVIVHLKRRYPPFVSEFFAPLQEGGKPVLPAHIIDNEPNFNRSSLDQHPIGTGPFRFVSWQHGTEIVLERFDRYFKGKPKLARIELHVIPDDETIATEVRVHHIDLVVSAPESLYDEYKTFPDVVTQLVPWNAQQMLILNCRKPGLSDVTVRRAIASAIDYGSLIRKVSSGIGEVAYNTLPPTAIGYERLAPHSYDPAAANRELNADGWMRGSDGIRSRNGIRLAYTLAVIAGSSELSDIALQIQQNLQAIGIEAYLKAYPYDAIFAAPNGPLYSGAYDFALFSSTLQWDPDVHFYVDCNQWYPHGENIYGYCNPALDRLETAGLQTDDPVARANTYRQASRIMWDTISYLPLYEMRRLIVRSPDLKGFSTNPTSTPWWNAYQWDI